MDTKDKVKKYRKEKKLTQKQLGELSGLSEITIRKLEAGKSNPKIETLQKIANGLNVSLSDITDDLFSKYLFGNKSDMLSDDTDNFLWAFRDHFNLSVKYLSNATGIDIERYKKIENNEEKPTDIELEKIYNVLELNGLKSLDRYMLKINNDWFWVSRKESLIHFFDQLNAEGQEKAIESVELLTKIPEYKK
ncbi:MAG: transcriptional regulator [Acetobacterium sp.]|nr:transcriptional regulator [Bacillota bacterium]MCG2729493.1 transcriptional regulator [Acetobacterium sp.]